MSSNPHELYPLTILCDALPLPTHATGPAGVRELHVGDLLAEPPRRSGEWMPGIVRRLLAASTGPVAAGVRRADYRERLEAAGWFCAAEDADLEAAREASWPALPIARRLAIGAGSLRPNLVLVGESVNRTGQTPFACRAGTWLFLALRMLGYDELTCYVTNVLSLRKRRRTKQIAELAEAFGANEPTWVGLGVAAQEVLSAAKVKHLSVWHPQYHKRYKHAEDVIGYARRLRDAGLADGPRLAGHAALQALPGREVVSLPELPPPFGIRTIAYARGTSSPSGKGSGQGREVEAAKREAARRMYVMDEAPSVKAAAEAVGANAQEIKSCARKENWKAERAEHAKALTERTKAAHLDSVAEFVGKALNDSLKVSWGALRIGLADVARRLRLPPISSGSLQLTPQQVESLSRVALSLRAASTGQHDPELDALVQEPLAELAKRTLEQLEKGLGGA